MINNIKQVIQISEIVIYLEFQKGIPEGLRYEIIKNVTNLVRGGIRNVCVPIITSLPEFKNEASDASV